MTTLLQAVRTVKSPTLPRDDEDAKLREAWDPDGYFTEVDAAVLASAKPDRPVNMRSGVDAFLCSPELARFIAARRI
jgi:hypothetical protein